MSGSLSKIKAILLDMDGTLIDTELLYKMSWQQAAQELEFEVDDETYQQFLGIPLEVSLKRIKTLLPSQVSSEIFLQQLMSVQDRLKQEVGFSMKPGARELLSLLLNHSIPTALVTSSRKDNIAEHFTQTPFDRMFDVIVSFEDVTQHKPHPAPYISACHQLSLLPEQTLVIEDSNNGAISAIHAGCQTIIVPGIFPPDPKMKKKVLGIHKDLYETIADVIQPILTNYHLSSVFDG